MAPNTRGHPVLDGLGAGRADDELDDPVDEPDPVAGRQAVPVEQEPDLPGI